MSLTVTMPQLGESVTEGTLGKWLKQPGDPVERYESICEVISDKVNAEIPAPAEGVMGEHLVDEGAVVPVGQPICLIEEKGAETARAEPAAEAAAAPATRREAAPAAPAATALPEQRPPTAQPAAAALTEGAPPSARSGAPAPAAPPGGAGDGRAVHVTPAVRMLAREHGVDLSQVSGSGIGGRVTKKDVLEYVQLRDAGRLTPAAPAAPAVAPSAPPVAAAPPAPVPSPPPAAAAPAGDTLLPLSSIRRSIAEHMVRSRQTSPHAWVMVEVDMSATVRVRAARREELRRRTGVDPSFLPFVARVVVACLQSHPTLNASWTEPGIVLKGDINLGIAVALEDNLIVPVVRNAERLNLEGLVVAIHDVVERARRNRLRVDDVQGGTFTLNNAGALGTVLSQAIINQPQAAILVMDAIVKRPVVLQDDAIAVRPMMNLSVSFDHRINDGLQAARFLRACKEGLEGMEANAALL